MADAAEVGVGGHVKARRVPCAVFQRGLETLGGMAQGRRVYEHEPAEIEIVAHRAVLIIYGGMALKLRRGRSSSPGSLRSSAITEPLAIVGVDHRSVEPLGGGEHPRRPVGIGFHCHIHGVGKQQGHIAAVFPDRVHCGAKLRCRTYLRDLHHGNHRLPYPFKSVFISFHS